MPTFTIRKTLQYFIPALLSALVVGAQANSDVEESIDCDNAQTTLDLNYCAGQTLEQAKAEQAKYFAAAKLDAKDAKHVAEMLDVSQKAFEEYRKSYCASIYQYWIEGSIRNLMNLDCETRLTRERTHNLWQDYLVAMDGTETMPAPTPVNPSSDE